MAFYSLVFSPTGGTSRVCEAIVDGFGEHVAARSLLPHEAQAHSYVFNPDDLVLLGVPSFGGRVPSPWAERMTRVQGNGARAILVAVYGNRAFDDTLIEMSDLAVQAGLVCVAGAAAVAEHSIVRKWATGRPDDTDLAELKAWGRRLRILEEAGDLCNEIEFPGHRPYKSFGGIAFGPQTDEEACVRCGLCADTCPTKAIPVDRPYLTDQNRCITCLACIAVCPHHARALPADGISSTYRHLNAACSGRKQNYFYDEPLR